MNLQLSKDILNESELKCMLTAIKSGERSWSEVDRLSIVKSMITHIGSVDAELRDQLIYNCFYQLIIEQNQLETEVLINLLEISLNDRLFMGIGENGTDTVFTRAFTTLLIALILYRDNKDHFLEKSQIGLVKGHLIQYMNNERDLRGYVPGKGWAHSIAHVADTFDELVKNPKLDKGFFHEILLSLWNKMLVSESVYIQQEDERVVTPIVEMMNNGLDVQEVEALIQNIPSELKARNEQLDAKHYRFLVFNSKIFLKSFYMTIDGDTRYLSIKKRIEKCMEQL